MSFIAGAYITSPNFKTWDPDSEERFFAGLARIDGLAGLELPFRSGIHLHDDAWLERNLRPEWDLVVTGIIGTAYHLIDDPAFGLASTDEAGRSAALRFTENLADGVARLNRIQGRTAVRAVELHSAPNRTRQAGTPEAFAASLRSLAGLDWHGADILVEHADALRTATPAKAFLELQDELDVVRDLADDRFGVALNWGRSAVETRDADAVLEHVRTATASGLLRAFTYTGTADVDNPIGTAWQDSHLGFADTVSGLYRSPGSLLTQARAREIAAALPSDLAFQGIKVAWPADDAAPETRAAVLAEHVRTALAATAVEVAA